VLQNADFRLIWYVGTMGEFGRRMELLVLSWLILQLTDSYFQLGLVLAFNNLSRPMISLYTGYIADRFPRGRVLIIGQALNVLTTATLLAVIAYDFELIEAWHVFLAGPRRSKTPPAVRPSSTSSASVGWSTPSHWT